METLSSGTNLTEFEIDLLGHAAFAVIVFALGWLYSHFASRRPTYRRFTIVFVFAVWVLSNCICVYFFRRQSYFFLVLTTALLAWVVLSELYQFRRIGLVGADAHINKGIDYSKALSMASSSLDFLGIGASKLTKETDQFEKAVDRCDRTGRPIRFLLSNPENRDLERIAQKAGVDQNAYKQRVTESLRAIANLKNNRAKNIELRFYREMPAFRLMFIDEQICLASHYIFGKGDGSQLPQLHIIRQSESQDVNSLYYGFQQYFEYIWEQSEPWDFSEYLGRKE